MIVHKAEPIRHVLSRSHAMKTNTRFIKSILETASKTEVVMPWARGSRRASFINKRKTASKPDRQSA